MIDVRRGQIEDQLRNPPNGFEFRFGQKKSCSNKAISRLYTINYIPVYLLYMLYPELLFRRTVHSLRCSLLRFRS